jgi:hypothetical protein
MANVYTDEDGSYGFEELNRHEFMLDLSLMALNRPEATGKTSIDHFQYGFTNKDMQLLAVLHHKPRPVIEIEEEIELEVRA